MAKEIILTKITVGQLREMDWKQTVLVPVQSDIEDIPDGEVACKLSWTKKALITAKQRRAMYKYFELLADALNAAGYDMASTMKKLSKKKIIPWSPTAVKEKLWDVVQADTYQKNSTTELETVEVGVIYEALNRVTSEKLGVSVPFPDKKMQEYAEMSNQYK